MSTTSLQPARLQLNKVDALKWFCRLVSAAIMLQTLYFKFTAAPESVYIFTRVGMEPWGRLGTGVIELIASLLLFYPPLSWLGSFLAATVMFGAIFSHLTLLGIEVQGDGGLLFSFACIVFTASMTNLYLVRAQIPIVGALLSGDVVEQIKAKMSLRDLRIGYLFLGVCVSIALIGVLQQVYTIEQLTSLSSLKSTPEVQKIAQLAYFITIVGVLMAFLLAMLLLQIIGAPIRTLTEVCRLVISGRPSARVVEDRASELGLMSRSFNHMLDEIEKRDANTRSLLAGIPDAVFFFDQNGTISKERSAAADLIFPSLAQAQKIANFIAEISGRKSDDIQTCVNLFWDKTHHLDFNSIADLLPSQIQLTSQAVRGGIRYVHLKFRAELSADGNLSRIIVLGLDRTSEELSAQENLKQVERVHRISNIASSLQDYLGAEDELNGYIQMSQKILESRALTTDSLVELKRALHSLKGGLSSFGFTSVGRELHEIESFLANQESQNPGSIEVSTLQSRFNTALKEYKVQASEINNVFALEAEKGLIKVSLEKIDRLKVALTEMAAPARVQNSLLSLLEQPCSVLFKKYHRYFEGLSVKNGEKVVQLEIEANSAEVQPHLILGLSSSFGHIFRNSFDHGIETAEEREALGKTPEGKVRLSVERVESGALQIRISDDGKGIDRKRLVEKAVQSGLWSKEKASSASPDDQLELIFASGLSTKDSVSETSGRGVGMDAVRAQIQEVGGHLQVQSEVGKGTTFLIRLA